MRVSPGAWIKSPTVKWKLHWLLWGRRDVATGHGYNKDPTSQEDTQQSREHGNYSQTAKLRAWLPCLLAVWLWQVT